MLATLEDWIYRKDMGRKEDGDVGWGWECWNWVAVYGWNDDKSVNWEHFVKHGSLKEVLIAKCTFLCIASSDLWRKWLIFLIAQVWVVMSKGAATRLYWSPVDMTIQLSCGKLILEFVSEQHNTPILYPFNWLLVHAKCRAATWDFVFLQEWL